VLLEVEEGQAVVDGGVGAAGQHQLDRLVEAIGADQFGAGRSASLPKLLVSDCADFLPLRSAKVLMSVLSPRDDQHGLGGDVGIGEIVLLLAGVGDADLVDDGVIALGVEAGDQPVPLAFEEFGLDAELAAIASAISTSKPTSLPLSS
jgi:hypothetical protein